MGLETGTYVSDLTPTNPISTDKKGQGDDHLRLIKAVLQATFPNASKAFYLPTTGSKTADFSVASTDLNKTFLVDTTSGVVTATLPTLASGDAGWECFFVKTTTDTNTMYIAPPSGTIQSGEISGLAKTRRCIPGRKTRVFWTGTAFIAERVLGQPVGSAIEYHGTSLPTGYEWPNGQTLNTTNYPDYASARGSGTTSDRRGRLAVAKDDMGGSAASRVTTAGSGVDGATFEATGGAEDVTLDSTMIPAHSHTATDAGHTHTQPMAASSAFTGGAAGGSAAAVTGGGATNFGSTGSGTASITVADTGGGLSHNNMPPAIVENFILVVE